MRSEYKSRHLYSAFRLCFTIFGQHCQILGGLTERNSGCYKPYKSFCCYNYQNTILHKLKHKKFLVLWLMKDGILIAMKSVFKYDSLQGI